MEKDVTGLKHGREFRLIAKPPPVNPILDAKGVG
jgi:hypothetical protein